jgi:hypothetical protein
MHLLDLPDLNVLLRVVGLGGAHGCGGGRICGLGARRFVPGKSLSRRL